MQASIGTFTIGNLLGVGAFGSVYEGRDRLSGLRVALKFLRRSDVTTVGDAERISRESFATTILQHDHIIRLLNVLHGENGLVLVLELASGGSLEGLMRRVADAQLCTHISSLQPLKGALGEGEARFIFTQILSAVRHLHRKHIVHRDLKPENILLLTQVKVEVEVVSSSVTTLLPRVLLSSPPFIKIGDFGLSASFSYGGRPSTPVGTPLYCSPEVIAPHLFPSSGHEPFAADVWACGVILFRIVSGRLPFEADDVAGVRAALLAWADALEPSAGKGKFRRTPLHIPALSLLRPSGLEGGIHLSNSLRDLLVGMLQPHPSRRLDADAVSAHHWCAPPPPVQFQYQYQPQLQPQPPLQSQPRPQPQLQPLPSPPLLPPSPPLSPPSPPPPQLLFPSTLPPPLLLPPPSPQQQQIPLPTPFSRAARLLSVPALLPQPESPLVPIEAVRFAAADVPVSRRPSICASETLLEDGAAQGPGLPRRRSLTQLAPLEHPAPLARAALRARPARLAPLALSHVAPPELQAPPELASQRSRRSAQLSRRCPSAPLLLAAGSDSLPASLPLGCARRRASAGADCVLRDLFGVGVPLDVAPRPKSPCYAASTASWRRRSLPGV